MFYFIFKAGYVETYKETKRRKEKYAKNNYSLDDYKNFAANFGFGKEFIDVKDDPLKVRFFCY